MKGHSRYISVRRALALCALAAFTGFRAAPAALAAPINRSSIVGTVQDTAGAKVPAVTLTVRNLDDNTVVSIASDATGAYAAHSLKPGSYEIVAAKYGFTTARTRIILDAHKQSRADLKLELATLSEGVRGGNSATPSVAVELEAMKARIGQLEAELKNKTAQTAAEPTPEKTLLATTAKDASEIPGLPGKTAKPDPQILASTTLPATSRPSPAPAPQPAAAPAPAAPSIPEALQSPDPAPAVDKVTPFAYGDQSWFNGSPRTGPVLDTKFFTPEIRFDTHFMEDFNQPRDHTMGGATESFRSGEFQLEQISVGGDFHWQNVRGRILTMNGLFATTTPRNDGSAGVGQWDVRGAYKYISEGWGGYHFDVAHGLNVDAGIFVSYIGLFSYYNFDNWTYQPSFVSSNTPWFFNGLRVQYFPTQKLKIEPWLINGWQSYNKFNGSRGFGGQILWIPTDWLRLVFNNYGNGTDTLGIPGRSRLHTDDSIEVRYYNKPMETGLSKMAFSFTADAGCEYGGGVTCHGGKDGPKQAFLGWMAYNRMWFHKDLVALTIGGGQMSNPGRYLTLLPPINGADAISGSPYFTASPADKAHMWDATFTLQYMPKPYITWWLEGGYRHSDIPYWTGRGGITPPGGNTGSPGQYVCGAGGSAGTNDLATAYANCGGSVWFPDMRRSQANVSAGVMVKF
jgi:hypothetical protein